MLRIWRRSEVQLLCPCCNVPQAGLGLSLPEGVADRGLYIGNNEFCDLPKR
jgi:hypothetical protein